MRADAAAVPLQSEAEEAIQREGRALILALYAAGQALRLYPRENATARNTLGELEATARQVLDREEAVDLHTTGQFLLLNGARLRLRLSEYAAFSFLRNALRQHDVASFRAEPEVTVDDWAALLTLLGGPAAREEPGPRFADRIADETDARITAAPIREDEQTYRIDADDESREGAKQTYFQSVQVAREMFTDVRIGRAVNARRVKRAVQGIVDQVLKDETSLMGMTTLRDYDEYTFTHSVNVCILSVVLGQKLGLTKAQLYELGLGALFHDIGKMRLDIELLNKPGALNEEEWRIMQQHPSEGLLSLFALRGFGEVPYRTMLMAYEHHMKIDLTGYPRSRRPREPTLYPRIVAVADGFDAATSRRSYQSSPLTPDQVLREMRDEPRRGYDPLLVKALMNVIGVYPVGTLVVLDTYELAVVVAPNPDPAKVHEPLVRLVADAMGLPQDDERLVDLSEVDAESGQPRRSIIKTTDPEKYGIRIGDYFL
ncbi:MAG: HD-GYP domain-containing protein [Gemmatimonadota bacterium]